MSKTAVQRRKALHEANGALKELTEDGAIFEFDIESFMLGSEKYFAFKGDSGITLVED